MVPEIWRTTDRIFCHFGPLFALFPPKNPENQNVENIKKHEEISSLYTFYFSFWVIFGLLQGFPQWWWGGEQPPM